MSLVDLWAAMAGESPATYPTRKDMVIIDGQSLGLGHNGTAEERTREGYRNRPASRMHKGLMRGSAPTVAIALHGPLSDFYAPDPATGLGFAIPVGNIPACLTFASALDLWRRQLGLPLHRMIVGFNGIGGQSIVQFDHDPLPDPYGTKIRDNHSRWLAEMMSIEPSAVPLLYACIQGEADVAQTSEWYLAQAHISYDAALDDIEAATGIRPPVMVWQTGAYTNGTTTNSGSTLAQLQLVEDYSAAFAGPLYPNFLADNVVHPTLDYQVLHTEIAAMVWAHREAGQNINLLPLAPEWSGNTVRIPFSVRPGHTLAFEAGDKYAAYGGLVNHGVEATGANITSVTLDGNAVVVTCDGRMTQVQIALQSQDVSSFGDANLGNYGAHRCDIMESDPEDSLMLTGWKLKRFVPSCRFVRPTIQPYLNDPAAVARGLTISDIGPEHLSFTSNDTDARRGYSLPIPPAGSVIEFDVTTNNTLHFRLSTSTDLGPAGIISVLPSLAAGTQHVSATVPAYGAEYLWIGFLTQSIGQNVQITNWKVFQS